MVERRLMLDTYRVPPEKLELASFFCESNHCEMRRNGEDLPPIMPPPPLPPTTPGFDARDGFTTIGTFHHKPNVDSVRWLAEAIWPLIRAELPTATMRVYGSYPTEAIRQLHKPECGFLVEGFAPTIEGVMDTSRVLLAPLRFGAGVKGKIVDAWTRGLPVVTTPVGAEGTVPGMSLMWPEGLWEDRTGVWGGKWRSITAEDFAADAIELHENREAWDDARIDCSAMIDRLFPAERNLATVRRAIDELFEGEGGLEARRGQDYFAASLWHHTARSTEYFSRWIEMKETGKDTSAHGPEGVFLEGQTREDDTEA